MRIYYQGTDITDLVQLRKCIVRDTAGGRCDSLEMEFENAAGWYSWGPEEDDRVSVVQDGYDSGTMYVNRIIPANGRFRIIASALPCRARTKGFRSYYMKTVEEIMHSCAMLSGMEHRIYGIDGSAVIPYIEREDEGCAAFLDRLLTLEGAVLKCVNGKMTAIGIEYAQDLSPVQTMELPADQQGTAYQRAGTTYKTLTVKTPFAAGTATDTSVAGTHMHLTDCTLPALNDIQAARWARGKLLSLNRQCESVKIQGDFSPSMSAMVRLDIDSTTDAAGQWIFESVEHDLHNLRTSAVLRRCIWTIQ